MKPKKETTKTSKQAHLLKINKLVLPTELKRKEHSGKLKKYIRSESCA